MKNPNRERNTKIKRPAAQAEQPPGKDHASATPATSPEDPTELARITANALVEIALAQQQPEDCVAELAGLRELLLPHPGFRHLCEAIEGIAAGFETLCTFNTEVHSI